MSISALLSPALPAASYLKANVDSLHVNHDVAIEGDLAVTGSVSAGSIAIVGLNANALVQTDGSSGLSSVVGQSAGKIIFGDVGGPVAGDLLSAGNGLSFSFASPNLTLNSQNDLSNAGSPTFNSESLTSVSNQLLLGAVGLETKLNAVAAAASRVVNIPDSGVASSDLIISESNQTINGVKTFSDFVVQKKSNMERTAALAESIPNNVDTEITLGTLENSSNFPSVGPVTFNIPFNGKWLISYMVQFSANAVGERSAGITTNSFSGDTYAVQRVSASAAGTTILSGSVVLSLVSTDAISCFVFQNSGAGLNINDVNSAKLSVVYLGA